MSSTPVNVGHSALGGVAPVNANLPPVEMGPIAPHAGGAASLINDNHSRSRSETPVANEKTVAELPHMASQFVNSDFGHPADRTNDAMRSTIPIGAQVESGAPYRADLGIYHSMRPKEVAKAQMDSAMRLKKAAGRSIKVARNLSKNSLNKAKTVSKYANDKASQAAREQLAINARVGKLMAQKDAILRSFYLGGNTYGSGMYADASAVRAAIGEINLELGLSQSDMGTWHVPT